MGVTQEIETLKGILNHPGRLAITAFLARQGEAGFRELVALTGLSAPALSQHLRRLEEASLVEVSKGMRGRMAVTRLAITRAGREALAEHWRALERVGACRKAAG